MMWLDGSFERLQLLLGEQRLLECEVILPTDAYFPDPYDGSLSGVNAMAKRIAGYMHIDTSSFEVAMYGSTEQSLRKDVPLWSGQSSDAAGLYFHDAEDGVYTIGVNETQLADPIKLSATLAHELAHVLLLGGGLLKRDAGDMEPLTDLTTVYLGLGILTASAAFQFQQWTGDTTQGWSVTRQGYLPEKIWAYALAKFAFLRKEQNPSWAKELPNNIRSEYRAAEKWLQQHA